MIKDPLLEKLANEMYMTYLHGFLRRDLEDFIDSEKPMSFEEYVEDCGIFKGL